MEEQIKARYQDSILQDAMQRYGIADGQVRLLDGFESFIYEYERGGVEYILRLSHSLRRSEALIQGEVDWINHLAAGGISVARAICSENDRLVEVVEDRQGGQFLATAFIKAKGQHPWQAGWTPGLYETYGNLLGRMHARTIGYQPANPAWRRPEWNDEIFEFVEKYLPVSEGMVKQKYRTVIDHVCSLPKEDACYGVIHQDAHGSNLFVDQAGDLTVFDFDECAYGWFINDIAIALFYIAMDAQDPAGFTREFMRHFLSGYQKSCALEPVWLKEIPFFLKIREIELYAVMHRDFDVNNIDDPWCARFMLGRKAKIEQDRPFIDFDFETLAAYL